MNILRSGAFMHITFSTPDTVSFAAVQHHVSVYLICTPLNPGVISSLLLTLLPISIL